MLEKTTYAIFDSPGGKTIVFNNLYFINGEFVFNGYADESEISTYPNVHYRHTNFEMWRPVCRELLDEEIETIETTPYFYLKETMHYHPGHTLMDDIFSMFYSIYKCGLNYNPFICLLDNKYTELTYDCKGMFSILFGHVATTLHALNISNKSICFKTFVIGNGDSGFSSFNHDYVIPYQDNIWRKFRDAFYKKAGIKLGSGQKQIYINIGGSTEDLDPDLKDTLKINNINIIDWSKIKTIKSQLEVLKDVKIYITGDGSGALNCVFLPDNATMINLGRVYAIGDYVGVASCDDSVYPALSYIDVFYFEDYFPMKIEPKTARWPTPDSNDLIHLIKSITEAKENDSVMIKRKEIYDKFASVAIDRIDNGVKLTNFSLNARLFIEHFPEIGERIKLTESFKGGNRGFAMCDLIRPFREKLGR